VVKLLLNLSKEEQRTRFLKRIDLPEKNWKFSAAGVRERGWWDDYQKAFSEMLSATSTRWAPWYVIPADHKWFARICASAVIVHTLVEIDPQYPVVSADRRQQLQAVRAELEAEAPKGAPADPFAAKEATADAGATTEAGAKAEAGAPAADGQAAGDAHPPGGTDNEGQRARASRARAGAAPEAGRPGRAAGQAGPRPMASPDRRHRHGGASPRRGTAGHGGPELVCALNG
jgi:Polyphosphate kinase 2 (PPK2)